jgi:hypothetical protein
MLGAQPAAHGSQPRWTTVTLGTRPLAALAAAAAAAVLGTGCGVEEAPLATSRTPTTTTAQAHTTRPPAPLRGRAADAARAVGGFTLALRNGDVERVCTPNAIFTAAVVRGIGGGGLSCEAAVEAMLTSWGPPRSDVLSVAVEPDLATARVRVRGGRVVPLTLLRAGKRWLLSFSDGNDPLSALYG